ncbi:MAG: hypothetical protein Q8R28_23280 [Dehalococcoidia bacterium]|nr:hypothetical protein [Dehalococcoidia bacterium]
MIQVRPDGTLVASYDDLLDLRELGHAVISRASMCEPDENGDWWADLSPVDGPLLGPFRQRADALQAEREWLEGWLTAVPSA